MQKKIALESVTRKPLCMLSFYEFEGGDDPVIAGRGTGMCASGFNPGTHAGNPRAAWNVVDLSWKWRIGVWTQIKA